MPKATFGVIIGNRDFFPDQLITEARKDIMDIFSDVGVEPVLLGEIDTKLGGVETYADAEKCATLFRTNRERIDGVVVVLPNFGNEKGVVDTLRLAGLNVPVLVQGYPDDLSQLGVSRRRDAYCGKISVCNNLIQYAIPFTLTNKHVAHPKDQSFKADLAKFLAVCRVVNGLRSVRLGAIGARPGAFNTVRYSEKILERNGISVTTVDLSEILSNLEALPDDDAKVQIKLKEIVNYAATDGIPQDKLIRMAKLRVVLANFIDKNGLDATAIQCWTSVQKNYGINVCTSMSMMSEEMLPSACEVDVLGALTMYAMQLASGSPSALADWNNNYADDDNKCVLFHCGNWAKSFLPDIKVSTAPILGSIVKEENTYGALEGRALAGPLTFGRLITDEAKGVIRAYLGEGLLTDEKLATFGSRAVADIPNLQKLMNYVCRNGFEHHVAINQSHSADILAEAFETYLGWEVYYHEHPEA